MPKELHNRRADNWRVLLSIADSCERGEMAREAAIAMSREHQDEDPGVELLTDLRRLFSSRAVDRLASAEIVGALNDLDNAEWSEWRGVRGNQQPRRFSQAELAKLLRPFGMIPRSVWSLAQPRAVAKSAKGYYRHQFVNAWRSYCADDEDGTPAQSGKIRHLREV
jgi:hypothetical protein